jgi:hypothetical protein
MTNQPISQLLRRLWSQFESRRRVQLKLLLALTVIASFAEVLSIGAALPFLAVLTSPEKLFDIRSTAQSGTDRFGRGLAETTRTRLGR